MTVAAVLLSNTAGARPSDHAGESANLQEALRARVEAFPDRASAWRVLGRFQFQQGSLDEARFALERAVRIDPHSAAAHFDLARTLLELGRDGRAAVHFNAVLELAPDSHYAAEAAGRLESLPDGIAEQRIVQAGYETTRFDGSEKSERLLPDDPAERSILSTDPDRLDTWVEFAAVHNSNVALTPISRELAPETQASFQGSVAPELEYALYDGGLWRAGPAFAGDFTLNEGNFRGFNLQSYRPGAFLERFVAVESGALVPRLQYEFTHDEFDGATFGDRHALTASLAWLRSNGNAAFTYWTIDHTNFADDGAVSSITSRDGWTNAFGFSYDWRFDHRRLRLFRAGVDFQRADTDGSDFRFNGVSLHMRAVLSVIERTDLVLTGGWGYRDYFDFEFEPSRNENIWRAGVKLRRRLTDHFTAAAVLDYDRFDSDNPLFAAERFVAGFVTTFEH